MNHYNKISWSDENPLNGNGDNQAQKESHEFNTDTCKGLQESNANMSRGILTFSTTNNTVRPPDCSPAPVCWILYFQVKEICRGAPRPHEVKHQECPDTFNIFEVFLNPQVEVFIQMLEECNSQVEVFIQQMVEDVG